MGRVVISYSGGVDSAFLLHEAVRVLGPDAVRPVLVVNETVPAVQRRAAVENARWIGVEAETLEVPMYSIPGFAWNPSDRCARCKRAMYGALVELAGDRPVADGATTTDVEKRRIGLAVARERGVVHPLVEADLSDGDVRSLAAGLDLPFATMPSTTCLATRFPEGKMLDVDSLRRVERAEEAIISLGFPLVRVRLWGGPALVQVSPDDVPRLMAPEVLGAIRDILAREGIGAFEVDPAGYRES